MVKLIPISPTTPIKAGVVYRVVAIPDPTSRAFLKATAWVPIIGNYIKEFYKGQVAKRLEQSLKENGFVIIRKEAKMLKDDPFIEVTVDFMRPKHVYAAIPQAVIVAGEIIVVALAIAIGVFILKFAIRNIYEVVGEGFAGVEDVFKKYGGYILGGLLVFWGVSLRRQEAESSRLERMLEMELLKEVAT